MPVKGISSLIDSDVVDESQFQNEHSLDSIETNNASPEAAKKKGGRPKGSRNRVTKPRTTTKKQRSIPKTSNKTQSKATSKRRILEEKANEEDVREDDTPGPAHAVDVENIANQSAESEDELDSPRTVSVGTQSKDAGSRNQKKTSAAPRKRKLLADEGLDLAPSTARQGSVQIEGTKTREAIAASLPATKKAKLNGGSQKQKANKSADGKIDEPQDITTAALRDGHQNDGSMCRAVKDNRSLASKSGPDNIAKRRAGSASDTERTGGDPNLRRKLGDVTRKFENVEQKYHNLKETGVQEANANVERLRKQCEATTQASNELVAALKKELASQTSIAQGSRKYQRELQVRETELTSLRSSVAEMSSHLSIAQNEIRSLQAKLAASRSASAHAESAPSKTPASAMKHQTQPRTVITGSTEAAQAAQTAQLKQDLYSDLTGLIMRGVKKTEEGDLYDCIQTGRNGTLHFKLAVEEGDGKATSFEETEFLYTPFLDKNRDRDLLAILPDYLTEEITFSREHAAKFYSRVVDALTKRRTEEDG
ncbi:MAG: hypothetical protein Q9160_000086 [Pyrenula sp. 1 TL-2023]